MKHATWIPIVAALLLALNAGSTAEAGYCGAASYKCCPTSCCAPSGEYAQAKQCCTYTCYKPVKEIVWETEEYTCCKTVYDRVCEKVPVTCVKTVYETHYKDVCYTVCKPVYKTCIGVKSASGLQRNRSASRPCW